MTPWLTPPARGLADPAAAVPRIVTARLLLRAPRLADWPVLEPIWTSERAVHIGGPVSAEEGWLDFCQIVAGWMLRGFGGWTIERREDGAVLGLLVLHHEWGDAEPELGWLLTAEAEGQGYASEAAAAAKPEAERLFGAGGFVSYAAPENARSHRIAAALGGVRDTAAERHAGDVWVWRYGVLP